MSSLTVFQSKASNDYTAATSYKYATFTAVGSGNSLVMIITALTAELPFVIEPQAYNGTTDVPLVLIATDTSTAGMTRHLYKLDNITHAPTSIRYKVNAASGSTQQASTVWEIGNTGGLALTLSVNQKTTKGAATSFSESFTTVSANELALVNLRMNLADPTVVATSPALLVTHGNGGIDDLYDVDMGAAGAKSIAWTTTSSPSMNVWIVTFSNTSTTPTVTSVTSSGITEGGSMVFTASLSGATSGSTNYAFILGGAATAGTDYTSPLTSGMCSNGVTVSGSDFVVPDAVSSWTVTIPTTSDTLDEDNETLVLTVGGTASTGGTITDDDAAPTLTGTASSTVTAGDPVVITYSPGLSGQTRTYTLALTDGTAVGGTDYDNTTVTGDFAVTAGTGSVSISGSTVTVDPGVTEFTLTITTTA